MPVFAAVLSLVWGGYCGAGADEKPAVDQATAGTKARAAKPPLGQLTLLVPQREFKTEGENKALRVTFDDLDFERVLNTKELRLDTPEKMPEWWKKLDGKRIRLRGFMHPASSFEAEGIKRFVFWRDTSVMNFGVELPVYRYVDVNLKAGSSTSYIDNKPLDVEGVFHLKPKADDEAPDRGSRDKLCWIYTIEDAAIIQTGSKR